MVAKIIDGNALAKSIRAECRQRALGLRSRGCAPKLVVIIVGDDAASYLYVRNKVRACHEVGVDSELVALPASVSEEELLAVITRVNHEAGAHGLLVQLPLPGHISLARVLDAISPIKDVDGFHLYNVGSLVTGNTVFPPCTPYGVQKLLEAEKIEVRGQNVVIVGASNIVGKPMALLMMQQGATVTVCHALTRDLAQFTILADILVVAAGKPGLIHADMVKEGAVVLDVGINRMPDGSIVGDVDFDGVSKKASHITPVPGGVGPMTVTMLIVNTLKSAESAFDVRHGNSIPLPTWALTGDKTSPGKPTTPQMAKG